MDVTCQLGRNPARTVICIPALILAFLELYNAFMEHPQENPYSTPKSQAPADLSTLTRWKFGRQLAGWGLLAVGVAGLVLPILPGWVFIGWGAVTLAPDVPFFARLLDRIAHRVPQLRAAIERVQGKPEN